MRELIFGISGLVTLAVVVAILPLLGLWGIIDGQAFGGDPGRLAIERATAFWVLGGLGVITYAAIRRGGKRE